MEDASLLFERVVAGEPGAAEEFLPLVYAELRKLAAALAKKWPRFSKRRPPQRRR